MDAQPARTRFLRDVWLFKVLCDDVNLVIDQRRARGNADGTLAGSGANLRRGRELLFEGLDPRRAIVTFRLAPPEL